MARVGAARIFFDVVGSFQAQKFMAETKSGMLAFKNITESIMIDTMTAVTDSVRIFGDAFQQVLDNTVPLATNVSLARIEFEKFARGITNVRMEEMQSELRGIGEEFAFTAEQSFQAGARMSQLSGILKSQEAVLAATRGSLQFGFVGGMTSETAAQRMIQLQAQTNFMFGKTTEAQFELMSAQQQADLVTQNLNKTITSLNTIENRSAATMEDLTFVMNQFASAATLAGDSIEQMAAFSAVLIEAGEQQGKAGRALRMIYARLGSNIKNNNAVLEQYIGTVKDASGTVLPLSDILGRLNEHWDSLTGAEKQNIAQTVAGNDHYIRFIKLMDNYDRSVTLATQAMQGLDDVTEEMALFQEDPSFQLKILQAELENVREEMGQKLTPVVIGQTKAQIRMTQANTDLITSFLALGDAVGVDDERLALFMELGSMLSNMANTSVERFINIKNMNVALTTQHLILQAISGEQFVQARGTDNIAAGSREQVGLLQKQMDIKANLAILNSQEAKHVRAIHGLKDLKMRNERITRETQSKISDLLRTQSMTQLKNLDLGQQQNLVEEMKAKRVKDMLALEKQRTQEIREQIKLNQNAARFRGMEMTGSKLGPLADLAKQLQTAGKAQAQESARQMGPFLRLQAKQALFDAGRGSELSAHQKDRLHDLKAVVKQTGDEYLNLSADIREYIGSVMEARGKTSELTFSKKELDLAIQVLIGAEEELAMVSQQLGIEEQELANIMQQVRAKTMTLEDAMNALSIAKAGVIEQEDAEKLAKFQHSMEEVNMTLNAMAIGAGMASMAVAVLGKMVGLDKRESAAAAMIAMHSSMVFTTVQMIHMQAVMISSTNAAIGFKTALASVTRTALLTAGVIGLASIVIGKIVSRSQEAKQAEQEHLESIIATNQALSARTKDAGFGELFAQETRSNEGIKERISLIDEEIAAIENLGRTQTLATQQKKADFKEERDMLTSILRARQANALTTMSINEGMVQGIGSLIAGGMDSQSDIANALARYEEQLADADAQIAKQGNLVDFVSGRRREDALQNISMLEHLQKIYADMTDSELAMFVEFIDSLNDSFDTGIDTIEEFASALEMFGFEAEIVGDTISTDITGSIDEAQESLEGFNSALEEFFFGGQISLATGDLLKQVVNKGAENLIQNTELIMTNNFFGLTLPEMVDTISEAVTDQLMQRGIVQTSGMSV